MEEVHSGVLLADYVDSCPFAKLERDDMGVLVVTFHTDGGPLQWVDGLLEFPDLFSAISLDPENKVVIITGTGDTFNYVDIAATTKGLHGPGAAHGWGTGQIILERLQHRFLEIPVPMIGAVNGPANAHMDLVVTCDIVIASETATFDDRSHFSNGIPPGDGVGIYWPLLLGLNRAKYFMLTGQVLTARECLELGVVNEVLPPAEVLPRAIELGRLLAKQPQSVLRATRAILNGQLRELYARYGTFHVNLEGIGAIAQDPRP